MYDLNPLRRKGFDFVFDAGSGIQDVVVKKLRLSSKVKKGDRITLEADATHDPGAIYDLLAQVAKSLPLHLYNVTQVELVASVNTDAGKPPKAVTMRLTHPNSCSLKYDELDLKLRDMLHASGIEPKELTEAPKADAETVEPAQEMTAGDAFAELLARVGANQGAAVLIGAQELSAWPQAAVAVMKTQKLLVKARPAASVVCPGCERECVMPVHVPPAQGAASRAFVVCDKRSDINRVNVPIDRLEQWQASGEAVADLIARLLDLRRPRSRDSDAARWEIGMLKGAKHAGHLVLLGNGELTLSIAGHTIVLADVLDVDGERIVIDRRMLVRRVDHPVAGAGDAESAAARRDRIKARVRAEKEKGTRAFLKVVAEEEGISVSRLKQLVKDNPRAGQKSAGLVAGIERGWLDDEKIHTLTRP